MVRERGVYKDSMREEDMTVKEIACACTHVFICVLLRAVCVFEHVCVRQLCMCTPLYAS